MISDFKNFLLFVILLAAAILSGCISDDEAPADKIPANEAEVDTHTLNGSLIASENDSDPISVATTIAPLAGLISAVGGDRVEIAVMIPPGAEPHTYEPTPSQMMEVANADVYIMNGAGLEFWMEKVLDVNEKMLTVDSSRGVNLLSEEGEIADPNIWMSIENAAIQVENIGNGLIQADPANENYYIRNKDNFLEELKALDRELNQSFAAKENKTFIVYHPAWSYFARDYDLIQVPIMEEEKEPGPQHLAGLIDLARKDNITTIFVDPQFNPKSAEVPRNTDYQNEN